MSDPAIDRYGLRVQAIASTFDYPRTPNIAASVRRRVQQRSSVVSRRLAWAALAAVLAFSASLAVPQVRAAIVEFFQIGVVRIFPVAPTETPTAIPTGTPNGEPVEPPPTPTLLPSLLNLAGETTLAEAQANAGFTISLPTYPANLGQPDRVFLQDMGGSFLVLVWLDEQNPNRIALSLHIIAPGSFAISKQGPTILENTAVHNNLAFWAEGPYMLQMQNGDMDIRRLIEGHVLIWTDANNLTYRVETDLSMDEAIKIAESLEPIKQQAP